MKCNYTPDIHKDFKVRQDFLSASLLYIIVGFLSYLVIAHIVFKQPDLYILFGEPSTRRAKPALFLSVVGVPLCIFMLIYTMATGWFRNLTIKKNGILDNMRLKKKEFISFEEINYLSAKKSRIVIKYSGRKKAYYPLLLSKEKEKKIISLYYYYKYKNNSITVTNIKEQHKSL
jgi:hypothetical protein